MNALRNYNITTTKQKYNKSMQLFYGTYCNTVSVAQNPKDPGSYLYKKTVFQDIVIQSQR